MAYIVYKSATLFLLKQARLIPLASMHTSGVISLSRIQRPPTKENASFLLKSGLIFTKWSIYFILPVLALCFKACWGSDHIGEIPLLKSSVQLQKSAGTQLQRHRVAESLPGKIMSEPRWRPSLMRQTVDSCPAKEEKQTKIPTRTEKLGK